MDSKYTKGVWEGLEDEGVSFTDGNETGFVFQTGCGCCTSSELNIYDAKLIAAAPELLEALIKVNNFINENKGKNYMIELLSREVSELGLLIKKAVK